MQIKNHVFTVVLSALLVTSVHAVPRGVREVTAAGLTAVAALTWIASTVPGQDTNGLRVLALAELAGAACLAHERLVSLVKSIKAFADDLLAEKAARHQDYETLGLHNNEPDYKVVKRRYYRLVRQLHPDKNQGNAAATAQTQKINQAYEVLKKAYPELATDGGETE